MLNPKPSLGWDEEVLKPLRVEQAAIAAAQHEQRVKDCEAKDGQLVEENCILPPPPVLPTPPSTPIQTTVAVYSPNTGDAFSRLRICESGGNYATNTGNGFYGAYQFDIGTWGDYGGYHLPSAAPPAMQDAKAQQTQAQRGWSPWPACSRKLGLLAEALSAGPNTYDYGQCTYYVATRRAIPSNWGNATNWFAAAQMAGFKTGNQPLTGAIAWAAQGHVAYVESVQGDTVTVSEMNFYDGKGGGWNRISYRTTNASAFSYIY